VGMDENIESKIEEIKSSIETRLVEANIIEKSAFSQALDDSADGVLKLEYLMLDYERDGNIGVSLKPEHSVLLTYLAPPDESAPPHHGDPISGTSSKGVRDAFQGLYLKAMQGASKQLELEYDPKYKVKELDLHILFPKELKIEMRSVSKNLTTIEAQLHVEFKILSDITKLEYELVKTFIKILDYHFPMIWIAAKTHVDGVIKGRPDSAHTGRGQDTHTDAGALQESLDTGTRLYQVSLKLRVDKSSGGGIEGKLNRIRAIDGVTVVGHEYVLGTEQVIEAKIKFHPRSDSIRPISYINLILIPSINSSRHVPGVHVLEMVQNSIKQLNN
jgi:hypothetical protein